MRSRFCSHTHAPCKCGPTDAQVAEWLMRLRQLARRQHATNDYRSGSSSDVWLVTAGRPLLAFQMGAADELVRQTTAQVSLLLLRAGTHARPLGAAAAMGCRPPAGGRAAQAGTRTKMMPPRVCSAASATAHPSGHRIRWYHAIPKTGNPSLSRMTSVRPSESSLDVKG